MKWVRVLRKRGFELWRLVHPSGAVLAEIRCTLRSETNPPDWMLRREVVVDENEIYLRPDGPFANLRQGLRYTRARVDSLCKRWSNDPSPPSLDVESIARESWRKRRAKKRAALEEQRVLRHMLLEHSARSMIIPDGATLQLVEAP